MSDFETVPRGTLEKLEAVKAERDALVAHVEGLRDALKHLRHNAYHSGAEMGLALEVADDALSEPQLTSLARLKAQWQAEALTAVIEEAPLLHADMLSWIDDRIRELTAATEADQ